MSALLEIACFSLEACFIAQKAGAHRIEFCHGYNVGGITPPFAEIKNASELIKVPLVVMIRPHAGDFIYSSKEKQEMLDAITACRVLNLGGIVFGALDKTGQIDVEFCEQVRIKSDRMSLIFHRAIDECSDLNLAIESLINCKIDRVLTSGGNGGAIDNLEQLKSLNQLYGHQINIMPGGGVRAANCQRILNETGCREIHSAAITGDQQVPNEMEIKSMLKQIA